MVPTDLLVVPALLALYLCYRLRRRLGRSFLGVLVPLIALVGWWLYAEAFDPFVLLGSALIVAGILWNLRAEARGARA